MIDGAYRAAVERALIERTAGQVGNASFDILRTMRGAPPDVVASFIRTAAFRSGADGEAPGNENAYRSTTQLDMEPHPLDFDWPFSPNTVQFLVNFLDQPFKEVVLLGAPRLARPLSDKGISVRLVERNPAHGAVLGVRSHHSLDLRLPYRIQPIEPRSCIFFDAPWYVSDLLRWLSFALTHSSDDTTIAFSLWPELIRPTAELERKRILAMLSQLGPFEVVRDVLEYDVPLFERTAFRQRGLSFLDRWRLGDLVVLKPRSGSAIRVDYDPVLATVWYRFSFGGRQVAVRLQHTDDVSPQFAQIGGSGWYLDSVSRRDVRRQQIGFWTSANFVADVSGSGTIISALLHSCRRSDASESQLRLFANVYSFLAEHGVIDLSDDTVGAAWTHLE